jgi:hypothetical protein
VTQVIEPVKVYKANFRILIYSVKVKIKQSHFRPGQALRVPGG